MRFPPRRGGAGFLGAVELVLATKWSKMARGRGICVFIKRDLANDYPGPLDVSHQVGGDHD
jgi:hypothetical protein